MTKRNIQRRLSEPGARHLRWLHAHGGRGTIDPAGRVVAIDGAVSSRNAAPTFLQLAASDYLRLPGGAVIEFAPLGLAYIEDEQRRRDLRDLLALELEKG